MKKIFASVVLILVLVAYAAVSFGAGAGVFSQQVTLASGVTTTATSSTVYPSGGAFTFDYPVNNVACDVIAGLASAANTTVGVRIDMNQGSSVTLWDTSTSVTTSIASSTTVTALKGWKATTNLSPVRTIRAVVTGQTSTAQGVTVNCTGTQ